MARHRAASSSASACPFLTSDVWMVGQALVAVPVVRQGVVTIEARLIGVAGHGPRPVGPHGGPFRLRPSWPARGSPGRVDLLGLEFESKLRRPTPALPRIAMRNLIDRRIQAGPKSQTPPVDLSDQTKKQ